MSQTVTVVVPEVKKLIPKLKIPVRHVKRLFSNPEGPLGRLKAMRATVTALVKHERIELRTPRALESRGYAERLIVEAIKNGDTHQSTMELADFWLVEKQLIHKLFKVLVPRYRDFTTSYTSFWAAPRDYASGNIPKGILELKGNPFPPLHMERIPRHYLLHNILLDGARDEFYFKRNEPKFAAEIPNQSTEDLPELQENVKPEMHDNVQKLVRHEE